MTHHNRLLSKSKEKIPMFATTNRPFDLDDAIIRWFNHRCVPSSGQKSWNTGSLGRPLGPCSLSVKKASSSVVGHHQNIDTLANNTGYGGRGSGCSGFDVGSVAVGCLDVYDEDCDPGCYGML
jgi:hypothetical protein